MKTELLKKFAERATSNGFDWISWGKRVTGVSPDPNIPLDLNELEEFNQGSMWKLLIFDREFLKSVFGEKTYKTVFYCGTDHRCKHEVEANKIGYKRGGTKYCQACYYDDIRDTIVVPDKEGWEVIAQKLIILSDEEIEKELERLLSLLLTVRCNWCEWEGQETDLKQMEYDGETIKGCPNCDHGDTCLMDI